MEKLLRLKDKVQRLKNWANYLGMEVFE